MKLYIDMEPQPEFYFEREYFKLPETNWIIKTRDAGIYVPPYKPGDVVWRVIDDNVQTRGEVKSCTPIQRDGRWKWEVELE